jgi:2-amino-4-hydroxy-6-hydroxymethyldihydropteridine diphosphokinase
MTGPAGLADASAEAYIALGANLGDPAAQVERALEELSALPHSRLRDRSAAYLSRPLGFTDQPDFVNAVARLDTRLSPRALLAALLDIEHRHGRERTFRNAPRTLDLDILLYDSMILDAPGLHLPHPRLHERAFVLLPLAEIAADLEVPGRGRVRDLLAAIDASGVSPLSRRTARAA